MPLDSPKDPKIAAKADLDPQNFALANCIRALSVDAVNAGDLHAATVAHKQLEPLVRAVMTHVPGADVPLLPPTAGASGAVRPDTSRVRHPEYLIDADPWRDPSDDPDERRLVTPPVIGEHDHR